MRKNRRGLEFCVCSHETAGECDQLCEVGAGLIGQLLACPPEEDGGDKGYRQKEESHAKEGKRDEKFVHVVRVEIKPGDHNDELAEEFKPFSRTQDFHVAAYLGLSSDIAGATISLGDADFKRQLHVVWMRPSLPLRGGCSHYH